MIRSVLLDKITMVLSAVEKKSKEPLFSAIRISGKQLRATNGRLYIRVDLDQDSGVDVCVPGHLFHQVVKSASCTVLELAQEGSNLIVKGDGTHVEVLSHKIDGLVGMDEVFLEPSESDWDNIPSGFLDALSLCKACCSSDDALHVLTGVYVNGSDVWSCDRLRISRFKIEEAAQCIMKVIIPTGVISEVEKHDSGVEAMCLVGDSIAFKLYGGKMTIAGALILGVYPDLSGKLVDIEDKSEVEFPGDFSQALKLHNVMLKDVTESDRLTVVMFTEHGVELYSESSNTGKAVQKVFFDVPKEMKDVSFSCNPTHFAKVVKRHKTMVYSPEHHVMVFIGDKFIHQIKTAIVG